MRGVDTTTEEYLALLRTADECVQAARAGDDEALGAAVARADADGRVGELLGVLAMSAIGWLPRGEENAVDWLRSSATGNRAGPAGRAVEWVWRCVRDDDESGVDQALRAEPPQVRCEAIRILAGVFAEQTTEVMPLTYRATILQLITIEAHQRGCAEIADPVQSLVCAFWRESTEGIQDVMRDELRDEQALRHAAQVLAPVVGRRLRNDAEPVPGVEMNEQSSARSVGLATAFRVAQLAKAGRYDQVSFELRTRVPNMEALTTVVWSLALLTSRLLTHWRF